METRSKAWGFLVPRHIREAKHNLIWTECLMNIRRFHPTIHVLIIDDHSTVDAVRDALDQDIMASDPFTLIVRSEFEPCRGELLPFLYFQLLHGLPFSKAVVIHDSMFIQRPIDDVVNNVSDVAFLWDFGPHPDKPDLLKRILRESQVSHCDELIDLYESHDWTGCFGGSVVITLEYLNRLNDIYGFPTRLAPHITDRACRCELERVIALVCKHDIRRTPTVLFGHINTHPWCFTLSIEEYCDPRRRDGGPLETLTICKTWHTR